MLRTLTCLGLLPALILASRTGVRADSPAPVTLEQYEEFSRIHHGYWKGTVSSTIGEEEITRETRKEAVYLDFVYEEDRKLTTTTGYGPRGHGSAITFYDPARKVIRSTGLAIGGALTEHTMTRRDDHWYRESTQTTLDGKQRKFRSTIRFSNQNNTITIVIDLVDGDRVISSQTNVWNRVEQ